MPLRYLIQLKVAAVAVGFRHTDDKYQKMKKMSFAKDRVIQFIN